MQTFIIPMPDLGPTAQALVQVFDNGASRISFRERRSDMWGSLIVRPIS